MMPEDARKFALAAHGEQKYGNQPYSVHLDAVANLARPFGETAEVIAYLHDVVEDTDVTVKQIEQEFTALIADAVAVLTDEPGKNRRERKSKTYAKMSKVTGEVEIALVVKAADRLANMRACVADKNKALLALYRSEYPVFRKSVFRAETCDEIWSELDALYVG
jgi:(p)ppGpp synthase/HD superfamily hydrolase